MKMKQQALVSLLSFALIVGTASAVEASVAN